jgi:ketosteroid isomerase-like protein
MKHAHLATALLLLAIATPAVAQSKKEKSEKKGEKAEQAVTLAYRELNAAETVKKDRAVMERLLADDYYYVHSNGNVANKAQDIAADMSPDNNWTSSKTDDLQVRVYGHVAVVTGVETLAGTSKGFVPGPRRFTEVWVRQADKTWKCAGGQSTLVPAPAR